MTGPTELMAVTAKEVRQIVRDPRLAGMLLLAPLIQLTLLGYAVNLDVEHVQTVVADQDRSGASRALVRDLVAGEAFDLVGTTPDAEVAVEHLSRGDASIALVIPRGTSADLAEGRPVTLQVIADGSDSNRAMVAGNALTAFVARRSLVRTSAELDQRTHAAGRRLPLPRTTIRPRIFYNPSLDSRKFFVPGVAATLLLVVILVITSMGLAREREVGTLEQVLVTPIRPTTLVLGKTLPVALIGMVDLGVVLAAGALIFDVPLRGPLLVVFLGGALYLLSILGLGLLVSTVARTQQQAFMAAFFIILPAILLSGFLTPVENMPAWLQPFTVLDPVRHFVEILRAVLLKSAGFADVAPQLVALGGMGVTLFLAAVLNLHRHLR
ncbi:MAG: ABC transporter permease [Myxococcota bacterium]